MLLAFLAHAYVAIPADAATAIHGIEPGPGRGTLSVRVVDGVTHAPIEGAELRWLDLDVLTSRSAFGLRSVEDLGQQDLAFEGTGVGASTRADGLAEIPSPSQTWLLRASAPGRFGSTRVYAGPGITVELQMFPDWPLTVDVVDHRDRPAPHVPVCLRRECGGLFVNETTTMSDEFGRAILPHVGYRIAVEPMQRETHWFAGLAILSHGPVQARIEARTEPRSGLRIALPPTGSVELRLGDALGRDVTTHLPLELRRVLPGGTPAITQPFGDAAHPWHGSALPLEVSYVRPLIDGRVILSNVALGLELQVSARRNEDSTLTVVRLRGPTTEGETKQARLVFGADHPSFRGRLLDSFGRPLAGEQLLIWLTSSVPLEGSSGGRLRPNDVNPLPIHAATPTQLFVRTDDGGNFCVDYAMGDAKRSGRRLTILHALGEPPSPTSSPGLSESAWRSASMPIDELWTAGVHNLGDVRIARPDSPPASGNPTVDGLTLDTNGFIAEGRVVSGMTGIPRPGVRVDMIFAFKRIELGETDSEGRFNVRGPIVLPSTRLRFFLDKSMPAEVRNVVPGTRGLVVKLDENCTADLEVRLPAGTDRGSVTVSVASASDFWPDERSNMVTLHHLSVDSLGRGVVDFPEPGRYSITVSMRNGPTLAGWTGDIEPGRNDIAIDLTGRKHARELEVVDIEGRVLEGWFLAASIGGVSMFERGIRAGAIGEESAARFLGSISHLDGLPVEIASPGYLSRLLGTDASDTRIVLERAPPVALELTRPIGLVPQGWRLVMGTWCRGRPTNSGREPRRLGFESTPFDDAGKATWTPPGRGVFWVEWILEETGPTPRTLRIQDTATPVIFERHGDLPKSIRVTPLIDPARVDFEKLRIR